MHRKLTGLGLALAFVLGPAQLDAQGITIGLKAGVNIADLSIDDPAGGEATNSRTVLAIGPFVEFGIGGMFSVQPEVLLAQKGAALTEDGFDLAIKLNYIEVPVLLKARISPPLSPVSPSVYVGPVLSFESKCEVEGSDGSVSVTLGCNDTEGLEIDTKAVDFGLALGAGVSIPAGSIVIVGDVRYTLGLSDINDTSGLEEVDIKNRAWSVFAGLGIPLGL